MGCNCVTIRAERSKCATATHSQDIPLVLETPTHPSHPALMHTPSQTDISWGDFRVETYTNELINGSCKACIHDIGWDNAAASLAAK